MKVNNTQTLLPLPLKLLILAISLLLICPFLYVILRTYTVGIERSIELLWRPRMWELLSNTLILVFSVTILAMTIGVFCAFCLERYHFWGKSFFSVSMALPLCIPAFVSCFTWISLTFRVEGVFGAIMIMTLNSFPLTYLPVSATLKRLDRSLEDISFSLGKSKIYTFVHVLLPQLKPALGSSLLLIALHMLIEFGAVSILNYPTFTTAIFQEYEMSFNNNVAALLSAVLMVICIFIVFGEIKLRGQNKLYRSGKGVIRSYQPITLPLYKQIPIILFFLLLFILSIGIPFIMLIYWLIIGNSKGNIQDYSAFFEAFLNSTIISALGATMTVIGALPLVWAAVRYRTCLSIWIDRLPYILHAVPGIIIALSLTYFTINYAYPFYQTFIVIVIAYFMLYLPMAQTTLRSALEQIPVDVEKIGQSLGRSPFYIFRTLTIPAMLPGIAAAFALVFLNLMKELTATLLLTPNDIKTLSIAVWEYTSDAQYAAATPYATMLVFFSAIPVFLLKSMLLNKSILEINGLSKNFNEIEVLNNISLSLKEGELLFLLGSSGCGKSTLLRTIAGFEQINKGRIFLYDKLIANEKKSIPIQQRNLGYVVQEGVLFPHLTVYRNIAYGLGNGMGKTKQEIDRVQEVMELTGISHLSQRFPYELSGGQQQRVALARALAPKPKLILLDEPFSALDEHLRHQIRKEMLSALRESNTSALFVTHDREEALTYADRIAIMQKGKILQIDTPYNLYWHPQTRETAKFIGTVIEFDAVADQKGEYIHCPLGKILIHQNEKYQNKHGIVLFRPEQFSLFTENMENDFTHFEATIVKIISSGLKIRLLLAVNNTQFMLETQLIPTHQPKLKIGKKINITLQGCGLFYSTK